MAKGVPKRYRQQASDLTLIRYGPEVSALTALMRQAQSDRTDRIRTARSTASLIQNAVDQARPQIASLYAKAGPAAQAAYNIAAPQLAAMPAGSPFAAAAALERSGLQGRLTESRAGALTDLSSRRIAAQEGAAYAETAADRDLAKTRGQIGQRAQDLAREQGAFSASTIRDLLDADASAKAKAQADALGRQTSLSTALIGQGFDPTTGKPMTGGKLDPSTPMNQAAINKANREAKAKGQKWLTAGEQGKIGDTLGQALHEAQTLQKSGAARHEVAGLLLEGADDVKGKPVYRTVEKNGKRVQERVLNPDGTQKTTGDIPGVQQIKSQLLVQAALDVAYDGHLSKRTQRLLHKARIQIGPLGVRTYGQHLKDLQRLRRNSRPPRVVNAPGVGGMGSRPT
jgi:hypothetical protein